MMKRSQFARRLCGQQSVSRKIPSRIVCDPTLFPNALVLSLVEREIFLAHGFRSREIPDRRSERLEMFLRFHAFVSSAMLLPRDLHNDRTHLPALIDAFQHQEMQFLCAE